MCIDVGDYVHCIDYFGYYSEKFSSEQYPYYNLVKSISDFR